MKKIKLLFLVIIAFSFTMIQSCKEEISGCVYEEACNYNSSATEDDGSSYYAEDYYDCDDQCINDIDNDGICDGLENAGFTVPSDCNYDPTATNNDGSCFFPEEYYNCFGDCLNDFDNDGICDELEIEGCNDPTAFNYAPNATDLGDCEYPEQGYNCDGSVNTFYTVDQLFGFGVSFNEIVNTGYTPNLIRITQTTITGCAWSSSCCETFNNCPDKYIEVWSNGSMISESGTYNDKCTSATEVLTFNATGYPFQINPTTEISLYVEDDDGIGGTDFLTGFSSFNLWNYITMPSLGLSNSSPTNVTVNSTTGCLSTTFTFELIWD